MNVMPLWLAAARRDVRPIVASVFGDLFKEIELIAAFGSELLLDDIGRTSRSQL